ncbi:hypothetical protein OHA27_12595 [Streptomyces sp. NBC_01619]|uniref:Uncharacterized protein n=1 Tax=Streptomyces pratisoli TaxID=3139917 RepID=A0ACC6Q9J0_9ACTN|nr:MULTISPECIES: hypothetical protein [unclassified Streptomyces]MCX4511129.1 hypothetical protein [Streptomyces sp. NBC_01619]
MSIIVKFFMAPDDTSAALTLATGPGRACESLSFGNFDPEEAVVEWECLLVGGSFEELVEAGEPRIVAGEDNGGCAVFAISPGLSTALADAERPRLRDLAASWVQLLAEEGENIDTEIADAIVSDLAALVSSARRQRQGVYCWVA